MAGWICEYTLGRFLMVIVLIYTGLVNNAGICTEANKPQPIDEVDEDAFDAHLRVNTRGVFLGCKYAVRQFKKQELHPCGIRGWIVNFASMVANIGMAGLCEFS
jgi:NAD(P)-dependent dehydrogenase (short-subunit alcohol dehydrogenase family)